MRTDLKSSVSAKVRGSVHILFSHEQRRGRRRMTRLGMRLGFTFLLS